jgi:hypothetical protein
MAGLIGGGGMSQGGSGGMGMPMGGMMIQMMPHCMKMAARQAPADQRQDTVVGLLAAMLEAGCETLEGDERAAVLDALQSRIAAMKT